MLCPVLTTPNWTLLTVLIPFPVPTALAFVTAPLLESRLLAIPLTRLSAHTTFVDGLLTLLMRTDIPTLDMLQLRVPRNCPVVAVVVPRDEDTLPPSLPVQLPVSRLMGNMVLRGTIAVPGPVYVSNVRVPAIGHLGMFEVPMAMSSSPLELPRAPMLDMLTIRPFLIPLSMLRAGFGLRIMHVSGVTSISM